MIKRLSAAVVLGCLLNSNLVHADQAKEQPDSVRVDDDGTVHIPAYALPLSAYMSDEARRAYIKSQLSAPIQYPTDIKGVRATMDRESYAPLLEKAQAAYPVTVTEGHLGGVRVDIVIPKGQPLKHPDRVLINLHGGMFMFGGGMEGLLESIPVASVGAIKVISVDYREVPEYHYPAANEDVISVYQALLKSYRANNIGIYGCSSGGDLTAMTVSWLLRKKLPMPGAVGMFCLSAEPTLGADHVIAGDSSFTVVPTIRGLATPPASPNPPTLFVPNKYFENVNPKDPLVAPALYPDVLAKFPPTLLITGTRDIALSSTVQMHVLLTKAGVDAELHVWDGMWHSFFTDVSLPESQEVYDVIAKFFERHLKKRAN